MGLGYKIDCMTCGFSGSYMTGVGMLRPSFDECLTYLHPKTRRAVETVIGGECVRQFSYSLEMASCQNCCMIAEKRSLTVTYGDRMHYETPYFCPKCKHTMRLFDEEDLRQIPCPNCRGRYLKAEIDLYWD